MDRNGVLEAGMSFAVARKSPDWQEVTLTRRGKPFARIVPFQKKEGKRVSDHAAFGMWRDQDCSVSGLECHG